LAGPLLCFQRRRLFSGFGTANDQCAEVPHVALSVATVKMAKFSTIFALVIAVAVSARLFAAHDLRELARRQAQEHPGDPVNLPKAPPDLPQRSIEQVARHPQVVLIVEASLSRRGDSYLSSDGQAVLTDDTIATVQLFADRQAVGSTARPGVTVPMILTRWGGEVTFEGVSIRCEDGNDRPIREGGTYLLFLSPSQPPQPGHFEVFGEAAFEIVDGRVSPLFKDGQDVFRRTIDANANDFRRRIENALP
jgi:hypothetical protein